MPSDTATSPLSVTGRCYCGAVTLASPARPLTVAYCHCSDCKRWTGAPAPAFAAFPDGALTLTPTPDPITHAPGVTRWFCRDCGSPLAATFDYLPGQVYVPIGLLDQADTLPPSLHCHVNGAYSWLHTDDGLAREGASARDRLAASSTTAP